MFQMTSALLSCWHRRVFFHVKSSVKNFQKFGGRKKLAEHRCETSVFFMMKLKLRAEPRIGQEGEGEVEVLKKFITLIISQSQARLSPNRSSASHFFQPLASIEPYCVFEKYKIVILQNDDSSTIAGRAHCHCWKRMPFPWRIYLAIQVMEPTHLSAGLDLASVFKPIQSNWVLSCISRAPRGHECDPDLPSF